MALITLIRLPAQIDPSADSDSSICRLRLIRLPAQSLQYIEVESFLECILRFLYIIFRKLTCLWICHSSFFIFPTW